MANHDSNHTTDELEAIREEGRVEGREEVRREISGTPRPDESTETIRRLARQETRPIVKDAVRDHADYCEHEGPLCSVAKKVDDLRVSDIKGKVLMSVAIVCIPVAMGLWTNSRNNERLKQEIETAAEVARHLKALQDATGGHVSNASQPTHFAQGAP